MLIGCATEDACVHLQPLPRTVHPVVEGGEGGGCVSFGKSSSIIIIGTIASVIINIFIISRIIVIIIIIIIVFSIIVTTIITCNEPSAAPKTSLTPENQSNHEKKKRNKNVSREMQKCAGKPHICSAVDPFRMTVESPNLQNMRSVCVTRHTSHVTRHTSRVALTFRANCLKFNGTRGCSPGAGGAGGMLLEGICHT